MAAKKQIIVLSGGGRKGIVKISSVAGARDIARISCSLDFRPNGAKLYLFGDNIAKVILNDTNFDGEVAFSATGDAGCVLRSSSVTMFGGNGAKSEMLKKIEVYERAEAALAGEKKTDAKRKDIENSAPVYEKDDGEAENGRQDDKPAEEDIKEEKAYVGVSAKSASPLGEWTKYDGNNFYYAVKPQIDEMFICYPSEELLTATVPNSKWVRVDAEDGYYVVGLLFDEDEPSYICYGVPEYQKNAKTPDELDGACVWLPLSNDSLVGYWMIYQSAHTGEIIK